MGDSITRGEVPDEYPTLRRFDIHRLLGIGGMGLVYEAFDRELKSRVALKTLRSLTNDRRMRFKHEFRAIQNIHHPNLVRLGELFEDDGQLYFTMELVDGVPFVDYVRRTGRESQADTDSLLDPTTNTQTKDGRLFLPRSVGAMRGACDEERLRSALAQVAAGLDALHRAGRVHRDIKSSNILVTAEGRAVILDFGLITEISRGEPESRVVGTAHFMAPEQAAARSVGPEADWYSVGVLLYVSLTGRFPLDVAAELVLALKQRVEPTPPGELVQGVSPDIEALCVGLLKRDPAERRESIEACLRLANIEVEVPSLLGATTTFIGRERELQALIEAFEDVRRGEPRIVLVKGESGIGKSALVRRFLDLLDGEARIFSGRCFERDSVPYKAVDEIIGALSRHLSNLPSVEREALLPSDLGPLCTAFPDLHDSKQAPRAPTEAAVAGLGCSPEGLERRRATTAARRNASPGGEHPRPATTTEAAPLGLRDLRPAAFAGLRTVFYRLAQRGPLVLVIDDLQWTDVDSLALLADIMMPPDAPRLLLLATVREASDASGARAPLELPEPLASGRQIRLERLSAEEAAALVSTVIQKKGQAVNVDIDSIVREADGHPLFLDALLQHRIAHASDAHWLRLDDALWSRIQRLDEPALRLLTLVAVAGAPLPLDIVAHATATAADDIVRNVVPLEAAHLLRVAGAGSEQSLETYHDRVRETVVQRLDPAVSRAWHGRLALALESSTSPALEPLAVHWRDAGEPGRAADYAEQAGEEAAEALAFDRAARLYQMALTLRAQAGGGKPDRRLLVKLGDALDLAGRGGEAALAYLRAAEGAPADEATALRYRSASCYLTSGFVIEGTAVLREVLDAVGLKIPSSHGLAIAELLVLTAKINLRGLAVTPRSEAEIDPKVLERLDICLAASTGLSAIDFLWSAVFLTRYLWMALEAGEPSRAAVAITSKAVMMASRGERPERTAEILRRARALGKDTTDLATRGGLTMSSGMVSFMEGRFRPALERFDQAIAMFRGRRISHWSFTTWQRSMATLYALEALWALGDLREFTRRISVHLREARERDDRFLAFGLSSGFCNARWLIEDKPDQALAEARAALRESPQKGFQLQDCYHLMAVTQQGLYEGVDERAYRTVMDRWPSFRRSPFFRIRLTCILMLHLRARATLAHARSQERSRRRALLKQAAADAKDIERTGAPWAMPFVSQIRATIAAIDGDHGRAAELLGEAVRGFESSDAALYAAAMRRRWGESVGGEQGGALVAAANGWMRDQGVVNPDRMTAMLAPAPLLDALERQTG